MTCPKCGSEDTLFGRDWKCLDCGWEWGVEMPEYKFDAERFCTNNFGRGLMLPNGEDCFCMIAKEIRALKEERDAMADALKTISELYWTDAPAPEEMREIARAALVGGEGR